MALPRRRQVGTIPFVASTVQTLDLTKDWVLNRLWLVLTGILDVTVGATIINESPQRLIRRVSLLANGETLQVWSGEMLHAYWHILNGTGGDRQPPAAGVAANAFRVVIPFNMGLIRSGRPELTWLVAKAYQNGTLRLEVTWGAAADLFSAGTATINSVALSIQSEELQNDPADLGMQPPYRNVIVSQIVSQPSAADSAFKVPLPLSYLTRGVLIRAATQTNNGRDLSDAVINSVIVRLRGTNDQHRFTWDDLRSFNQAWFNIAENLGSPATGFRQQGYGFIDFLMTGLSDMIDPRGWTDFDLVFDVDANTHISLAPINLR